MTKIPAQTRTELKQHFEAKAREIETRIAGLAPNGNRCVAITTQAGVLALVRKTDIGAGFRFGALTDPDVVLGEPKWMGVIGGEWNRDPRVQTDPDLLGVVVHTYRHALELDLANVRALLAVLVQAEEEAA